MTGRVSQSAPGETAHRYRLGDLVLDVDRRRVIRNGQQLALGKLTFEFLLALTDVAPAVLSKEALMDRVWAGRVVSPETVAQRVKLLREALGDDADLPRYIEVVRGQGYRLIPSVVRLPRPSQRSVARWRSALAVGSLACAAALTVLLAWPDSAGSRGPSIAVLPFESLSKDARDRELAAAVHNELLTHLSWLSGLRVVSRTSVLEYSRRPRDVREIGVRLDVDAILEGTLQRQGDNIHANVQLIDATTGDHLWARIYDFPIRVEDLLATQVEMTNSIATALEVALSPNEQQRLQQIPTRSTLAYTHYLSGNDYLGGEGTEVLRAEALGKNSYVYAAEQFERATVADPDFALAWAGLARALSAQRFFHIDETQATLERARRAIDRAFELEPDLPEAHLAKAYFLYHGMRDFPRALAALERAAPGMAGTIDFYKARSRLNRRLGRLERALPDLARAAELDPLSADVLVNRLATFKQLHDYERSEQLIDELLSVKPDYHAAQIWKPEIALFRDGDTNPIKAVAQTQTAMELPGRLPFWTAMLYDHNYEAALRYLDAWDGELIDGAGQFRPKASYYGWTHALAGSRQLAARHFDASRTIVEAELSRRPRDPRVLNALSEIAAHADDALAAVDLAKRAVANIRDESHAPDIYRNAMFAMIVAGEHELALDYLNASLEKHGYWSAKGLLPDPRFNPIRSHPRFRAIMQQYSGR